MPRPSVSTPAVIDFERATPTVREYKDEVLTGRVRLDNASFSGCTFRNATLVYAGMGSVHLGGCTFEGTVFEFDGPAARTLGFLQAMSHPASGLKDILKAAFPRLFGH